MTHMMMNELKEISTRLDKLRRNVEKVKRRKSRSSVPSVNCCHDHYSQMYPAIVMFKCRIRDTYDRAKLVSWVCCYLLLIISVKVSVSWVTLSVIML